ncbi:ankyrin repeat-containing domain protein [Pyrenochaeta sp. MPI-SDFR-AT-0127]|nr:ankyrin repeat-containing domain protein [Pyrenochaeta sp. MPI-SDFR-AT-0127]
MPNRESKDEYEWELHKNAILHCYIDEHKPLSDVIQTMAMQGFSRTKPRYERSFRKWGITKNLRKQEWEFIFNRLEERQAHGKTSKVIAHGVLISQSKLKKQGMKERRSVFDRCVSQLQPSPRSMTPPGIEVFTPRSLPSLDIDVVSEERNHGAISDEAPTNKDAPNDRLSGLPEQGTVLPTVQPVEPVRTDHSRTPILTPKSEGAFHTWLQEAFKWQRLIISSSSDSEELGDLLGTHSLCLLKVKNNVFPNYGPYQIGNEAQIYTRDLSLPASPLLGQVISTNSDLKKTISVVIARARDRGNLLALKHVLGQNSHNPGFCAQNLLVPAAMDGNLPLVKILIKAGVHVNTRMHWGSLINQNCPNVTALQMAVHNRHEDIIIYLLSHGADDWHAEYEGASGYILGSVLDIVMEMGNRHERMTCHSNAHIKISRSILKTILECNSRTTFHSQDMLSRALRLAILQDRLDLIDILFEHCSRLLDDVKSEPWIFLEAASTIENTSMIQSLTARGLDLNATNVSGHGSVMAAAAKCSNTQVITYLIAAHADINGVAHGLGDLDGCRANLTASENKIQGIHGMTALHIAVRNNDEELTRLLLYHGANSNQCCRVYPVQLAAWNGHAGILQMLIEAHADVNAVPFENECYIFEDETINRNCLRANQSAMSIALEKDHSIVAKILRDKGAKVVLRDTEDDEWSGLAVLCDAIAYENAALV